MKKSIHTLEERLEESCGACCMDEPGELQHVAYMAHGHLSLKVHEGASIGRDLAASWHAARKGCKGYLAQSKVDGRAIQLAMSLIGREFDITAKVAGECLLSAVWPWL